MQVTDFITPQQQGGRKFAILSPYLVPREMQSKRINLGDGFILEAIQRLLGPFSQGSVQTSRVTPTDRIRHSLSERRAIILGGANQLSDRFSPWPSLTAAEIRRSSLVFVPMGVGMNGEPQQNRGLTPETQDILRAIHERIEYSSWRCPRTVRLLEEAMPDLKGQFLMTGCPVIYDHPILLQEPFHDRQESVAVTVTERGDFWEREATTLREVARLFPKARKFLVLHQDFRKLRSGIGPLVRAILPAGVFGDVGRLHGIARKLGYTIVNPRSAKSAIEFYSGIDLHVGSRLHAHLLFLSRSKRSFLTYVDDRCMGFADFLKFPVIDPANLEHGLDFDFTIVQKNAVATFDTMRRFITSLEALK